jgi:ParB family chromosome partitioning protein
MFIPKRSAAVEIPIEEVKANPDQPRKVFEAQELEALSASIREFGVLQPIIVKKG